MGKYEKKKVKKPHKWIIPAIVLVIVLALFMLFAMPQILYKLSGEEENFENEVTVPTTESQATEPAETTVPVEEPETTEAPITAVAFPLLLENGKLEIEQVFQFDGINPDSGNQEGNDIAAVTVKNLSDTYLASANITVTGSNGEALQFAVTDLPAGKETIAFSVDNASAKSDAAYVDVTCEAVFDADASMSEDKVSVSVDGTLVTLRNNTKKQINELTVYCHCTLGDQYFGGITYMYTVNNLPANGTVELDAIDCILGLAEVVRIVINEP